MQRRTKKHLYDIRQACGYLLSFSVGKSLDDCKTDVQFRSAMERQFQIAGEALIRLRNEDQETAARISDYRQIIGFRHILVHGYDTIDPNVLWDSLQNGIPILLREVETLLSGA